MTRYFSVPLLVLGLWLSAIGVPRALAGCIPSGPAILSGATVKCSAGSIQTGRIGDGPNGAPIYGNNVTVNVNNGAAISVIDSNTISLGSNAVITLGTGSGASILVQTTTTSAGANIGQYGKGDNTIEFNNNSTLIINSNASVVAAGPQETEEAINPIGSGNTIINYGTIKAGASSAIFFENVGTTGASPRNTVDNYGIIDARGGSNPVTGGEAIGSFGAVGINITNETGAAIYGNLDLQDGNDNVTLLTGSLITGSLDGGGGTNVLNLDAVGGASDSLAGVVQNFQYLDKTGAGTWALTGSVGQSSGAPLAVTVQGGTLVLTGNNAGFNGSVTIDSGATLEARAQSLPPYINDLSGRLLLSQPTADNGTYAGTIVGPGIVTKIGGGTVALTGSSTYSGGTYFNEGALAVGADSALGAPTGALTFYGGTLQLTDSFNLSASRPITLNGPSVSDPGGGTIDTNGYQTTVAQAITGVGGLVVADSSGTDAGAVILTGANTYTGGTTINAGTLQLGNGGTTGSIVGNVVDNSNLAFNRSDAVTFPGLISGTGVVSQAGTGSTTLPTANTYSGGTFLSAGTLIVGNNAALGTGALTVATNPTGTTTLGNTAAASSLANAITLNPSANLIVAGSNPLLLSGTISGGGALTKNGASTLVLTADNSYSGGTTINTGTLQVGNGGATGSLGSGPVLDNSALVFNRSGAVTVPGAITGTGSLTQQGVAGGTLVLTGANSYGGGTTISAGTLQLGDGGTSGSITGNVLDNGTLAFNRTDVVTFGGTISGSGSVLQAGSGMTVLNANNPFTGGTMVNSGVLVVGDTANPGAALSGGGATSIAAGATLAGYGSITGPVTNNGTIAVGNALAQFASGPNGTLTVNGNLVNNGVADIASAGTPGNTLLVNGNYTGGASSNVTLKTILNGGGALSNQFTDRLLVTGSADPSTVTINAAGTGGHTAIDVPDAADGISIIQVAGAAAENTFTLAGGYVTGGTPYQYHLYAYGPGSPNGPAFAPQSLVGNAGNNWDYRLQNVYVTPEGPLPRSSRHRSSRRSVPANRRTPVPPPVPPGARPEVAPQVPAYLTTPTALFNAYFQDLDSLHRRLGEIRDDQLQGSTAQGEVFLRTYGSLFNYTTNRSFTDYGYNSSQDYAATQFGGNWIARNNTDGTLRVGMAGTIGRLWFEPSAVDGASKGLFNTQSLAGTVTWQSRKGWYVDEIVMGGMFDGTVTTASRGQTLGFNGTSFAFSGEAGYPIPLGWQGLSFEPQVQAVYQHLGFSQRTDVDDIAVDMGSPDQGIVRGGFRVTKLITGPDGMLFTPYLKGNVLQGLGGGDTVNLGGVPFGTGKFGTALQAGGGVTGTLTHNVSVYGDVAWQHNVGGDGGSRGWALNGGLRFAFGEAPPAATSAAVVPIAMQPARSYLVFFDWDKATLTDRARQIIAQAADASFHTQVTRIEVNGYTDTSGAPKYNQALSVRRAEAVTAELVRHGVPRGEITVQGFGETHLLVPTGPGVREPQNRRVEIILR